MSHIKGCRLTSRAEKFPGGERFVTKLRWTERDGEGKLQKAWNKSKFFNSPTMIQTPANQEQSRRY